MHFRRLVVICSLVLIGGLLAACGSDEDASPTATTSATTVPTDPPSMEPTTSETSPGADDGTPTMSDAATPQAATPVSETAATPLVQPVGSATAVAKQEEPAVDLVPMSGTLTLDGREQQDYTATENGCVGLGDWRMLKPGTQVILRDATGTVVDIAELEAEDSADTCAWSFELEAPDTDFFSVSIPMVTEVWFAADDAAVQAGEIELTVP